MHVACISRMHSITLCQTLLRLLSSLCFARCRHWHHHVHCHPAFLYSALDCTWHSVSYGLQLFWVHTVFLEILQIKTSWGDTSYFSYSLGAGQPATLGHLTLDHPHPPSATETLSKTCVSRRKLSCISSVHGSQKINDSTLSTSAFLDGMGRQEDQVAKTCESWVELKKIISRCWMSATRRRWTWSTPRKLRLPVLHLILKMPDKKKQGMMVNN